MKKLFLLPLMLLSLCACGNQKKESKGKTSLDWCVSKIQSMDNDKYKEIAYSYNVLETPTKPENEYNLDGYIINTYTSKYRTEWYCYVEYNPTNKKYLEKSDIHNIHCSIVYEITWYD